MNIIITGAGRGIGFELVKLFAVNADNRIIAISRNITDLSALIDHPNVIPLSYDLENLCNGNKEIVNKIHNEFSHLDILINNAGLLVKSDFEFFELSSSKKMFDVNFFAPAIMIRELLPLFSRDGNARIVNIGSMGGYQGSMKFGGMSMYSASKAALSVLSECLAVELEGKNISCNCLALGSAETEMFKTAFPGFKASSSPQQMAEKIYDFSLNGHLQNNGKVISFIFNEF